MSKVPLFCRPVWLAAAVITASPACADVVKIAQIEPLSGPLAAAGQVVSKQMQAIAEVANRQKWAGER